MKERKKGKWKRKGEVGGCTWEEIEIRMRVEFMEDVVQDGAETPVECNLYVEVCYAKRPLWVWVNKYRAYVETFIQEELEGKKEK